MNTTLPTALLLVLILLVQSASAVATALPCTPEHMAASAIEETSEKMSDHTQHANHHADAAPTDSEDRPDCCDEMNTGACTAGGCAAGFGSAMTTPLLTSYSSTNQTDRRLPLQRTSRYGSPPSAIFRPPIS